MEGQRGYKAGQTGRGEGGYLMEEGGERGMRLAFDTACQRPEGQGVGADSQTDV